MKKNLCFISENYYVMSVRRTDSDRSACSVAARCSRRVWIQHLDFSERRDRASWGMGEVVFMLTKMKEENKRRSEDFES